MTERVLSRHFDRPEARTLPGYRALGGYEAFRKALALGPEGIAAEVKKANLRGLGGAGFPTATKWGFIPAKRTGPVYLVVNADEGEPGTFKDRYILERDPHALIEGMLIAAYAIGCHTSFIYIRGEYVQPWRAFVEAVRAAEGAGLLGDDILGSGFAHRMVV
ncbi:MAG: NADH-quinone oxidoreductase subunit F, partial [Nocardioidaceae bacterium]